jgi:hypothetical protein
MENGSVMGINNPTTHGIHGTLIVIKPTERITGTGLLTLSQKLATGLKIHVI